MTEYRPISDERRERYHAILQQAFDLESGPAPTYEADEPDEWPPDLSDPRGVVDDGELRSVCKLYYLDATVRGEWTEIGGLGGVATPPEHRRKGYSRETLRGALQEYRDRGVDLVALWPSTVRFYHGLGWGTAAWSTKADVPPDQLAGIADGSVDAKGGRFRQLEAEDWERLREVEVARAQRFGLSLRRSGDWWRKRTLAAWPGDTAPYVHGYEADGELRGYVLTEAREGEDGRRLDVQDLAGVDHATERRLLRWLANFDSQVETVRLEGPLAGELHELVPDPGELDAETTDGPMIRLTDVERGLASIAWPAGMEGQFVLDVADPLLDHNDGTFVVEVGDGEATVDPAGAGGDPDATLGNGTLSRLAMGGIGVERAERLGDLSVRNGGVRSTLEELFAPEPVCLREFF
ncbi:GNAT family N-acetyltransferase [Salinarchaeum chitinilyticum]